MLRQGKDVATVQHLSSVLHRFAKLCALIIESMPLDDDYRELEMVLRAVLNAWTPSTEARNLKLELASSGQRRPNRFLRSMRDIGVIVEEFFSGTCGFPVRVSPVH